MGDAVKSIADLPMETLRAYMRVLEPEFWNALEIAKDCPDPSAVGDVTVSSTLRGWRFVVSLHPIEEE